MSVFIESLKRLYEDNKVNINKLNQLLFDKKITETEFKYILGKEELDVYDFNK